MSVRSVGHTRAGTITQEQTAAGRGRGGEVRGGVGLHDLKDSAFMFSVFILDADETQIL